MEREKRKNTTKSGELAEVQGRRNFLIGGLGLAGGAAAGSLAMIPSACASNKWPPDVPAWSKTLGPGVLSNPYGQPSRFEAGIKRRTVDWLTADRIASISFTPLGDIKGIITPSALVFERYHAGLPQINPNQHRLMIHGMVKHPLILTMDEKSVGELSKIIGISQSLVSQHLARMRHENVVRSRRDAQVVYYSLKEGEAALLISTLYEIYCLDEQDVESQ